METIRPLRGNVLVKKVEVEDIIRGIVAPPQAIDKWTAQQVEVVAVGQPQLFEEIPDRLLSKKWSPVFIHGKRYWKRCGVRQFKKGDWVLIYPRTLCPCGVRDRFMVTYDNIMGWFDVV